MSSIQAFDANDGEPPVASCNEPTVRTRLLAPEHWSYRYMILVLVVSVKVGVNYGFDAPAGMEDTIIKTMKIDVARYSLLYSVYAWPTIVTSVLGGVLVDRFLGLRLGAVVFIVVAASGQLVFALGAMFDSFSTMVAARFFGGLAADISLLVTDALAAFWFRGKELTFMIAMLGFGCRLGGSLTLFTNQFIYDNLRHYFTDNHTRLGVTMMVSLGMYLLFGCVPAFFIYCLDRKGQRVLKRGVITRTPFRWKDIAEFGVPFWFGLFALMAYFSGYFPFVDIAQIFFVQKYGLSIRMVTVSETIIYLVSMASPLTGLLIHWTGYNLYWALVGLHLMLSVHLLYFVSNGLYYLPFIGNAILGLSHAIFNTTMWTMPAFLVSEHQLGTAYGIGSGLVNLTIALTNLVSGFLVDSSGYFALELLFICNLGVGVLSLCFMIYCLAGKDHPINVSRSKRKKLAGGGEGETVGLIGADTASLSSMGEK